jgi:ADP-ribose pyrophosphatase YjhB (NUDIX family)
VGAAVLTPPAGHPLPVACAIPRDDDDRIILIRRGFQPQRGRWSMPGGFVDLGETVEHAAARECMEEMGIEVAIGELVGVFSHPGEQVIVVVYAGKALGEPRLTEEALEIRAFAPSEIPWRELAFSSDERALRAHLDRHDADGSHGRSAVPQP